MSTAEQPPSEPTDSTTSSGPRVPPLPTSPYEFNAEENVVIGVLSSQMQFVGLFSLAIGIFVIVAGLLSHHLGSIVSGTFYAVIGIWTHRASVSLKKIVETRGHDLHHLLYALKDLRRFFGLLYWICLAALLLALCALAVAVVWSFTGR